MRNFSRQWPTLKRLLVYGKPWRKPLSKAVLMLWVAAIAEVSGPALTTASDSATIMSIAMITDIVLRPRKRHTCQLRVKNHSAPK